MKKIFALVFLSSAAAFGAVTACATTATGINLDNGMTSNYTGGVANGCAAVDLSFVNLGISNSTESGNQFNNPTLTNTSVFTTSTGFSGNAITPITFTWNPETAGDWDASASDASMTATFTGAVIANSSGNYVGGSYTQPTPNNQWFLNVISLASSGSVTNNSGNALSVVQTICLGTTTFSAVCAQRATLTSTYSLGSIAPNATTCSVVGSNTLAVCSGGALDIGNIHVDRLSFSTVVTASRNNGTVDLNLFSNTFTQFADTPEPSTFGLLGTALVGLGFLARRRRKA